MPMQLLALLYYMLILMLYFHFHQYQGLKLQVCIIFNALPDFLLLIAFINDIYILLCDIKSLNVGSHFR